MEERWEECDFLEEEERCEVWEVEERWDRLEATEPVSGDMITGVLSDQMHYSLIDELRMCTRCELKVE